MVSQFPFYARKQRKIANGRGRARRPLVSGHGSAAGGVPTARQSRRLSGGVTDTVEGPHVAGGLHQVPQGAEHLYVDRECRAR